LAELIEVHAYGGWCTSPLFNHLEHASEYLRQHAGQFQVDEVTEKLADHYLVKPTATVGSIAAMSDLLGVNCREVQPSMCRLAAAHVAFDRWMRGRFEKSVARSGANLILYADLQRYDETPMPVTRRESLFDVLRDLPVEEAAVCQYPGNQKLSLQASGYQVGKISTPAKIFATESRFAILVRMPPERGGHLQCFIGEALNWLQLLDRCTAEVVLQALAESCGVSAFADEFDFRVRGTTVDQHPSNIKAEAEMCRNRGPGWVSLRLPCNVHIVARCQSKAFGLMDADVSGLVNFSLSLAAGSALHRFRVCLAKVAARSIVIKYGRPPLQCTLYRNFVLNTFLSRGTNFEVRRLLLESLPNGNWQSRDELEIYLPAGSPEPDRRLLTKRVVYALLVCLTSKKFTIYPRHRWLGSDQATDEVGLGLAIAGLFERAYFEFQQSFGRQHRGLVPEVPGVGALLALAGPAPGEDEAHPADVPMEPVGPGGGLPDRQAGAVGGLPLVPDRQTDWAEINDRARRETTEWLSSQPLPRIMIFRMCLEPWRGLLVSYIDLASDEWELRQRAEEAKLLLDGPGEQLGLRRLRILEYAELAHEKEFMARVEALLKPEPWQHMIPEACSLKMRTLAFKLISRMGCLTDEYLIHIAKQCPIATFTLLRDRGHASRLQQLPGCLVDEFTQGFLDKFPGEMLSSDEAFYSLYVLALTMYTENVGLEVAHATMRRFLTSQSVQTHKVGMEFLSAQLVCLRLRRFRRNTTAGFCGFSKKRQRTATRQGRPGRVAKPLKLKKNNEPKKAPRAGPMRAFMRLRGTGQGKLDFRELHQEYKNLDPDSDLYRKCLAMGKQALATPKQKGQSSFGLSGRQVRRRQAKQLRQAIAGQGASEASAEATALVQAVSHQSPEDDKIQQGVALLRAAVRQTSLQKASEKKSWQTSLAKFAQQNSQARADNVVGGMPAMSAHRDAVGPVPDCSLLVSEIAFQHTEASKKLASFSKVRLRDSNIGKAMDLDWTHKCRSIAADNLPAIETAVRRKGKPACLVAGMCICDNSHRGSRVHRLRNRFLQNLKAICFRGSHARELLAKGSLLVKLSWAQAVAAQSPWASMALAAVRDPIPEGQEQPEGALFWHIGNMTFSPYKPAFHFLKLMPEQPDARRLWLQATSRFETEYLALATLCLDSKWTFELYQLDESTEPLGVFNPGQVAIKRLTGAAGKSVDLWPVRRGHRKRKGNPGHGPGDGGDEHMEELGEPGSPHVEGGHERADGDDGPAALAWEHLAQGDVNLSDDDFDEADAGEHGHPDGDAMSNDDEDKFPEMDIFLQDLLDARDARGGDDPGDDVDERVEVHAAPGDADGPGIADGELLGGPPPPEDVQFEVLAEEAAAAVAEPPPAAQAVAPPAEDPHAMFSAEWMLNVPGGVIKYYRTTDRMVAECSKHSKCHLTRTTVGAVQKAKGRPLGLLVAWLGMCDSSPDLTRAQHWDKDRWPSRAQRLEARLWVLSHAGGFKYTAAERPQRPNEPDEPDGIP